MTIVGKRFRVSDKDFVLESFWVQKRTKTQWWDGNGSADDNVWAMGNAQQCRRARSKVYFAVGPPDVRTSCRRIG
jgi:hypothetical protein